MEEPREKALISKTHLALSIFALSGWVAFYFRSRAPEKVSEKIVFKDREVFKDRVVFKEKIISKDTVRTVTKPDGTRVVTVSKANISEGTKIKEVTEEKEVLREKETQSVSSSSQANYSLGASFVFDYTNPLERNYELEYSQRIWITPVWGKVAVDTNKYISLGLRWEFK